MSGSAEKGRDASRMGQEARVNARVRVVVATPAITCTRDAFGARRCELVQRRAETPQDPAHGSRAGKYDPFVFKLEQVPRKRGSDARRRQAVATREMTNFHDPGAWYPADLPVRQVSARWASPGNSRGTGAPPARPSGQLRPAEPHRLSTREALA